MINSLIDKLGIMNENNYKFFYKYEGQEFELESRPNNNSSFSIFDSNEIWHPEDFPLGISVDFTVSSPVFLFGSKGLVSDNGGIIGIGLMWKAPNASRRGILKIAKIESNQKNIPFNCKGKFYISKDVLRGELQLSIVFYVIRQSLSLDEYTYQAQVPGTILGQIGETKYYIGSTGSIFPIISVDENNSPLWWVEFNWDDGIIGSEEFDKDNFCIYLNRSHVLYGSVIQKTADGKLSPLLLEILASVFSLFINKIVNEDKDVFESNNYQKNSVLAVAKYIVDVLEIDPGKSLHEMNRDIRFAIMNKFNV